MLKQPSILLAFDWYDRRLFKGIVNYATEQNWHISPYLFSDRNIPYGWRGDGAISCYDPKLARLIDQLEMPLVDVSIQEMPVTVPRVTIDNVEVSRVAARHFLDRGFRNFAYFSWSIVPVNLMRRDAFFESLRDEGGVLKQGCTRFVNQLQKCCTTGMRTRRLSSNSLSSSHAP